MDKKYYLKNPQAEMDKPDSGDLRDPDETLYENKKSIRFFCPDDDCIDPDRVLIIAKKKRYYFKHRQDYDHEGHPETLLHKSAIRWFEGRKQFEIPSGRGAGKTPNKQMVQLEVDKTQLEYRLYKGIRPDVMFTTIEKEEFAVEIVVTSDLTDKKRKRIENLDLDTIRLDLSEFYKKDPERCRTDREFVMSNLDGLLTDVDLKRWVPSKDIQNEISEETESDNTCWRIGAWLLFIAAIFLGPRIKKWLSKGSSKQSKKRRTR